MSIVLDARTGLEHPNGSVIVNQISGALARYGVSAPAGIQRYDAAGKVAAKNTLDQWRIDDDRAWVASKLAKRADATRGAAGGFPRDFEHIYRRVWEEPRQLLNGLMAFPTDSEVPLGARSHTGRRILGQGRAEFYRGGSSVPTVRTSYAEETFGVGYIVCGVDVNRFEAMSDSFVGRNGLAQDLRLARRIMDERINDCIWNGYEPLKLYGFLNYPSMPKYVESTAFDGSANGQDVLEALQRIADFAFNASNGLFQPDTMGVPPRIHRYISQTKLDATSTDTTILEFFLRGQDKVNGIKKVVSMGELKGVGPAGAAQDAIIVWRNAPDALHFELIQAPTPLPAFQATPFDDQIVLFAAVGGMVMGDMQQCVAFVTAA